MNHFPARHVRLQGGIDVLVWIDRTIPFHIDAGIIMDHGSIIMLSAVAKSWLFECRSAGNVPRESIPGECGLSQGSSKYRWLSGAESDESDVIFALKFAQAGHLMTTQLPVMPGQIPRKGAEDMSLTMDCGVPVLVAFHLKQTS